MKRRNFLKDGALLLGAPAAVGSTRLYGTPASVQPRDIAEVEKFKLPLSRSGIPVELWDSLAKVSKLWESVLTDETESRAFHSDPAAYFTSIGLDASDRTLVDESVLLLRSMASPAVQESLAKSDYVTVYNELLRIGAIGQINPSRMQSRIEMVLRENLDELRATVDALRPTLTPEQENLLMAAMDESGVVVTGDDLASIGHVLARPFGGKDAQPMCLAAVACVVAAIVAAYVSVVVAVTVALLAGVTVSVGVSLAVAASGPPPTPDPPVPESLMVPPPPPPPTSTGASSSEPSTIRSPFKGSYIKLDPVMARNTERLVRLSAITHNSGLQLHAARQAIKAEVDAVLTAMKNVGLISISDELLPKATVIVAKYSWKVLGIDTVSA